MTCWIRLLKKLIDDKSVDTSSLAAERDFIPLKSEVDKLGINKLVIGPSGWTVLKNSGRFRCW